MVFKKLWEIEHLLIMNKYSIFHNEFSVMYDRGLKIHFYEEKG